MKRWYNFYNEPVIKGQQAADLIPNEKGQRTVDQFIISRRNAML